MACIHVIAIRAAPSSQYATTPTKTRNPDSTFFGSRRRSCLSKSAVRFFDFATRRVVRVGTVAKTRYSRPGSTCGVAG